MAVKNVIILVVLACAWVSTSSYPQYPRPPPPPQYGPKPVYKEQGRPYNYAYAVNDDYKGLQFSAGEASDGQSVKGSYQVALPDGRLQNVDYTADHQKGYVADVSYKGYASYPPPAPYKPAPYKPAPYKPAPQVYRPAPYKPAPPVYRPATYKPVQPVYRPAPAPYH